MSASSRGAASSLESLLNGAGNIVEFLRNQQAGPNVYPGVPAEYTNWRDEQRAWAQSCVLFNQSYHMAELMVEGPDALAFLNGLGINSFKGFAPDKAKQFVPCSHDGYVIGDVILFYLAENQFNLVGRAPVLNWVLFNAEISGQRRDVHLRRTHGGASGSAKPAPLPLSIAGTERLEGDRSGDRPTRAGAQILQHVWNADRRPRGARVASRHGRAAGI